MSESSANERLIAFVVYPDLTPLDLVGPLQVLSSLGAQYRTVTVGERVEPIASDAGIKLVPEATFDDVPSPFALVVPGGARGPYLAMANPRLMAYVRQAAATAEVVASVCTGALVLAAAGLLGGRQATTHWAAAEQLDNLGARYVRKRWVEDGKYLTAAGVSAGIDMALYLAERLTDEANARRIQSVIEYDPEPPLGALDYSQLDRATWNNLLTYLAAAELASQPELLSKLTR
jgi:transcriptional regulator GlxA family with amidase domain